MDCHITVQHYEGFEIKGASFTDFVGLAFNGIQHVNTTIRRYGQAAREQYWLINRVRK